MSIDFRAQWRGNDECEVVISTIGREESPVIEVPKDANVCGHRASDLARMGVGQITSHGLEPRKSANIFAFPR